MHRKTMNLPLFTSETINVARVWALHSILWDTQTTTCNFGWSQMQESWKAHFFMHTTLFTSFRGYCMKRQVQNSLSSCCMWRYIVGWELDAPFLPVVTALSVSSPVAGAAQVLPQAVTNRVAACHKGRTKDRGAEPTLTLHYSSPSPSPPHTPPPPHTTGAVFPPDTIGKWHHFTTSNASHYLIGFLF